MKFGLEVIVAGCDPNLANCCKLRPKTLQLLLVATKFLYVTHYRIPQYHSKHLYPMGSLIVWHLGRGKAVLGMVSHVHSFDSIDLSTPFDCQLDPHYFHHDHESVLPVGYVGGHRR